MPTRAGASDSAPHDRRRRRPFAIGIDEGSQRDFFKTTRTIHVIGAATTAVAYTTTLVFDWM